MPMQAATVSVIGLRHMVKGKGDDESADQLRLRYFLLKGAT